MPFAATAADSFDQVEHSEFETCLKHQWNYKETPMWLCIDWVPTSNIDLVRQPRSRNPLNMAIILYHVPREQWITSQASCRAGWVQTCPRAYLVHFWQGFFIVKLDDKLFKCTNPFPQVHRNCSNKSFLSTFLVHLFERICCSYMPSHFTIKEWHRVC